MGGGGDVQEGHAEGKRQAGVQVQKMFMSDKKPIVIKKIVDSDIVEEVVDKKTVELSSGLGTGALKKKFSEIKHTRTEIFMKKSVRKMISDWT